MKDLRMFTKTVLIVMLISSFAVSAMAWRSEREKRADDFLAAGRVNDAIAELRIEIDDNPRNVEAYWKLSELYLRKGYINSAEPHLRSVGLLRPSWKSKIAELYQDLSQVALRKGKLNIAAKLHEKAVSQDSSLRRQSVQFYMNLAEMSRGLVSARFYQVAGSYASGDLRDKIGRRILAIGLGDKLNIKHYKKIAATVIGNNTVNDLLPEKKEIVIFSKTFTSADAMNEKGWIYTVDYSRLNMKKNDLIIISGYVPSHKEEIKVAVNSGWKKISRGNLFKFRINRDYNEGAFVIWVDNGVKAKVEIIRTKDKEPKYALIMASED